MCWDSVAPQVRGPFACGDVCVCVCPIQGVPDDAVGLKRLRADLESILTESNKRTKMLAIELTKIYDMVEDPPDIEHMDDEIMLQAWKEKVRRLCVRRGCKSVCADRLPGRRR